jgi:hypothetical protein
MMKASNSPNEGAMVDCDDSDNLDEGPVIVRRAAYDEGRRLYASVEAQGQGAHVAFDIARDKAAACRAAGDALAAGFWTEVFDFLMERETVGGDVPTIVLEDDEVWDEATGQIRKSGSKLKGSTKGSQ